MPRKTLTFFSVVTTGDGTPVETEVHSSIGGEFQAARFGQQRKESVGSGESVWIMLFIPDKYLSGITVGMKVTSSDNESYKIEYFEEFDCHQEITLTQL